MEVNQCKVAHNFWSRLRGVIGQGKNFTPIFFPHCKSIHTCFLRFPIKLLWVDHKGKILKEVQAFPWKFYHHPKAFGVIELPWLKKNPGQATVECALLLPFLLLLIFGFLQLGLILSAHQKLQYAAWSAAQIGGLTNRDEAISGRIQEIYPENSPDSQIQSRPRLTSTQIPSSDRRFGDEIELTLRQEFSLPIPFFPQNTISLEAKAISLVLCQENEPPHTCE